MKISPHLKEAMKVIGIPFLLIITTRIIQEVEFNNSLEIICSGSYEYSLNDNNNNFVQLDTITIKENFYINKLEVKTKRKSIEDKSVIISFKDNNLNIFGCQIADRRRTFLDSTTVEFDKTHNHLIIRIIELNKKKPIPIIVCANQALSRKDFDEDDNILGTHAEIRDLSKCVKIKEIKNHIFYVTILSSIIFILAFYAIKFVPKIKKSKLLNLKKRKSNPRFDKKTDNLKKAYDEIL